MDNIKLTGTVNTNRDILGNANQDGWSHTF
jgi:hypothetical protein